MTSDRPSEPAPEGSAPQASKGRALEVLFVATRLGLTSFGGPVAHLGYFHNEYVERRKWLSQDAYAEVVALAQALPGPASSQVGIAIGLMRAGLPGALLAWLGFTLPSAALLIAFAYGVNDVQDIGDRAWLHGLKLAAVAIVAFAVWGMARTLTPDRIRASIAIVAAILALSLQTPLTQLAIIVGAGVVGVWLFPGVADGHRTDFPVTVGRNLAAGAIVVLVTLLVLLPIAAAATGSHALALFDSFFRTGALVFGGGHVVLPLLEREVVTPGWVTQDQFLAGYGAAQTVPGPLFTLSAYLGSVAAPRPNGIAGGLLALVAIFLPSFLLVIGGLPFWSMLRSNQPIQAALRGVNAAVVGLLLAALYRPVITSTIETASDVSLALAAFGLLAFWKAPPLIVVLFTVAGAVGLSAVRLS